MWFPLTLALPSAPGKPLVSLVPHIPIMVRLALGCFLGTTCHPHARSSCSPKCAWWQAIRCNVATLSGAEFGTGVECSSGLFIQCSPNLPGLIR